MIELAQLKADFRFPVQSLWHSLSLYFQLGCAPSERPECGFSLKKSPILPRLSSMAFETADWQRQTPRKVGSPGKSRSVHSETQRPLRLGCATSPWHPPPAPLQLAAPSRRVSALGSFHHGHHFVWRRDVIWKNRMRPPSTWALGAGMWKERLMCCWSLCRTLSTKVSGEGLQIPLGTPRHIAHLLSAERHFWGTEVQSPEKGVQILGQGMATLPGMLSV